MLMLRQLLSRIALVIACFWASLAIWHFWDSLAFGQPTTQQQGLPGSGNSGYPSGATPAMVVATATTGGISVSLPSVPNQFSYLCGYSVSPGSATAAITINVQVVNGVSSPLSLFVGAPVTAVGITGAPFTHSFIPCIRSATTNQGMSVTVGALGAGGINQTANLWGYTE
jgi:hypothetical protein